MTTLVDYTARFLNTSDALDYTIHEIDDLTDRKVEAIEVDGDALARVVRARRGVARTFGDVDPYANTTDNGDFNLWDASGWPTTERAISDRRMAAVGRTVEYPMHQIDVRHESRAYPGAVVLSLI